MPAGCEMTIDAKDERVVVWCVTCQVTVFSDGVWTVPAEDVLLAMQRHIGPTAQPQPATRNEIWRKDLPPTEYRVTWDTRSDHSPPGVTTPEEYRRRLGMKVNP